MNLKNILIFVSGLVVGGAAGVFISKKHFKDMYREQYEIDRYALEDYYGHLGDYTRTEKKDEEEFEDNCVNPTETDSQSGGRMSTKERAEIKKKLKKNWEGTTNYAGMYKANKDRVDETSDDAQDQNAEPICENCKYYDPTFEYCDLATEGVSKDDSCSDFEVLSDESTPEEEAFDEHQKNRNKPPKVISAETYAELPAHIDKKVLYLYAYDETVVDEDNEDEPLVEPELLIGNALTKYGFIDNDERIIFVMNYALDTCYEVQKIDASWTDSH